MQNSNSWADSNQIASENGGIWGSPELGGGCFNNLKNIFKPNQISKLSKEALTWILYEHIKDSARTRLILLCNFNLNPI